MNLTADKALRDLSRVDHAQGDPVAARVVGAPTGRTLGTGAAAVFLGCVAVLVATVAFAGATPEPDQGAKSR